MSSAIKTTNGALSAGAYITLPLRGSFLFVRAATGNLTVSLTQVELGQKTGQTTKVVMTQNDKVRPIREFDSVTLRNDTASAVVYSIVTGDGDYDRPVPDIINVQVTQGPDSGHISLVDIDTAGQGQANKVSILPDDDTRINAYLTALAGNTDTLRIGDTDVDTDQGTPLAPGETVNWTSKKQTWYCSEGATASQGIAITIFKPV